MISMKSVLQTEHAGLKLILHTFQIPPPPPTPHNLNTGRDEDEFSEVENYQRQMLEQGQVKEKARVRERDLKSVRRGGEMTCLVMLVQGRIIVHPTYRFFFST